MAAVLKWAKTLINAINPFDRPAENLSVAVQNASQHFRNGSTDLGLSAVREINSRLPMYHSIAANLGSVGAHDVSEALRILSYEFRDASANALPEIRQLHESLTQIAGNVELSSMTISNAAIVSSKNLNSGFCEGTLNVRDGVIIGSSNIRDAAVLGSENIRDAAIIGSANLRDGGIRTAETLRDGTNTLSRSLPSFGEHFGEKSIDRIHHMVLGFKEWISWPLGIAMFVLVVFGVDLGYNLILKIMPLSQTYLSIGTGMGLMTFILVVSIFILHHKILTTEERMMLSLIWKLAELERDRLEANKNHSLELVALHDTFSDQQRQYNDLTDQIQVLKGQVVCLHNEIDKLRSDESNMKTTIKNMQKHVFTLDVSVNNLVSPGVIAAFAFHTIPLGWLPCDGTILDPANNEHSKLIALGMSRTPDLRGKAILHPRASTTYGSNLELTLNSTTSSSQAAASFVAYDYYIKL